MGYYAVRLELLPDETVCPNQSRGCYRYCNAWDWYSNTGDPSAFDARRSTTEWFVEKPERFIRELRNCVLDASATARKNGLIPAVQLNTFSDVDWVSVLGPEFFREFGHVAFHDFTRDPKRFSLLNYHLTLSVDAGRSETEASVNVIKSGWERIAMVVTNEKKKMLLDRMVGSYKAIDGDRHNLAFLHPPRSLLLLRATGHAVSDESGFVLR